MTSTRPCFHLFKEFRLLSAADVNRWSRTLSAWQTEMTGYTVCCRLCRCSQLPVWPTAKYFFNQKENLFCCLYLGTFPHKICSCLHWNAGCQREPVLSSHCAQSCILYQGELRQIFAFFRPMNPLAGPSTGLVMSRGDLFLSKEKVKILNQWQRFLKDNSIQNYRHT